MKLAVKTTSAYSTVLKEYAGYSLIIQFLMENVASNATLVQISRRTWTFHLNYIFAATNFA